MPRRLRTIHPASIDITLLLDRSGSMESIKQDTIGGVNSFINKQAKIEGECYVTVIQFDTQDPQEIIQEGKPIREATKLDDTIFVPRGGTPLFDAMAQAIDTTAARISRMANKPDVVIFVVMTDGEENSSRRFNKEQVFAQVTEKTAAGWQFVYLGANQDGMAVGASMGISQTQSATYAPTRGGTQALYSTLTANVGSARGAAQAGRPVSMAFSDAQRTNLVSTPSTTSGTPPTPPAPASRTRTPKRRP